MMRIEEFSQRVRQGLAQASFEQKRQLIELLIDRVLVNDGEVEIRYVVPTNKASEQVRFCHLCTDYSDGASAATADWNGSTHECDATDQF